jgi:hypothetical protein
LIFLENNAINAAISYYLRHQHEVEVYLQQRQQHATEIRKHNEAKFDPQGMCDCLMAHRMQ